MFEDKISQRIIPLPAYVFPLLEIIYYFGLNLCISLDSVPVKNFCLLYVIPLRTFYQNNLLLIFVAMVVIFTTCSKGSIRLTKFVRFNIIQAVLFNIAISCLGQVYLLCPVQVRENYLLTNLIINPAALGLIFIILYACLHVVLGRYPKFPIISEAAKLQTQRGNLDI